MTHTAYPSTEVHTVRNAQEDTQVANKLWADYAQNPTTQTRDQLVMQFERLAYSIANRYTRRGVQNEDLFQVARMGLVKAVDRFDPSTQHRFSTFATPTITGEIKRYFRDHSWNVHVPRGMQELAQSVNRTVRDLTDAEGNAPDAAAVAAHLGVAEDKVSQAMRLDQTNHVLSLDAGPDADGERPQSLAQTLGDEDININLSEVKISVHQAIAHLAPPMREVIQLRYLEEMSQRDVAKKLGLSQMQVSRIERRALVELRSQFALN